MFLLSLYSVYSPSIFRNGQLFRTMTDKGSISGVEEKPSVRHEEHEKATPTSREQEIVADFPEEKAGKLLRKVDFRLLPPFILIYRASLQLHLLDMYL